MTSRDYDVEALYRLQQEGREADEEERWAKRIDAKPARREVYRRKKELVAKPSTRV